ncbi:MAG TPA: carboxylating nicotinate-nucleotide diphosphorylase [Bacteroidales bacterium]|nr:MAG: nicotinate-nucleotide diphosphorylase (carboxylating) [Bacteroidetes bacterium GWF2_33_38]OFY75668.1 MAG: nicotinate-nucleotide diphosphorylase (carboxylating) [Bacteroidetes bacterium RIFOXYA12_FULL_33_9]OFY89624.1 MAG: nicotinate-nucleotide diphosphorylase (carboxylating) [Bacteroidetes bacterium RIFOXYA2_FULL_33_7]HBF89332.1 carboxylating nicotinate-nucleotide diphosphorylase [Bacteroidales bacterium]
MNNSFLNDFIENAIKEDIGSGDHTSLSCILEHKLGKAKLIVKDDGIIAGIEVAKNIFSKIDPNLKLDFFLEDGVAIKYGDIAFTVNGSIHSILKSERLVLNIMQRMSGIATETNKYVQKLDGLHTKILDTRKTTPGIRFLEKEAVKIGGGTNHRFGLFDMIMIKDNHIDYAGGIEKAILATHKYLKDNKLNLKVEIEARSIDDVKKILQIGKVDRIMLDNFSTEKTLEAVKIINRKIEVESSGGITFETIRKYAECGVDFISVGALTHHIKSLDMSLKAF